MRPMPVVAALLLAAGSIALATTTAAQVSAQARPTMMRVAPVEADDARHAQRLSALAPSLRGWVESQARDSLQAGPDADAVLAAARDRLAGQAASDTDIEALAMLVLKQAAADAKEDLHAAMEEMHDANENKRAQRQSMQQMREARASQAQQPINEVALPAPAASTQAPDALEARSDLGVLGEDRKMRIQLYKDRYTQALEAVSNLLKKTSDTEASITGNLK